MFYIELIDAEVKRETEKAILLNLDCDTACGHHGYDAWFPKSQLLIEENEKSFGGKKISAADWILDKKAAEIKEKYNMRSWLNITIGEVKEV